MAKNAIRTKGTTRRARRPSLKMATEVVMNHDTIARRAFEIYESRGPGEGDALADWVQAERELLGGQ
ncbi:MAG TPA: DUF2934 domain-containing protein [Polyangiaceae bacterium]|nr:DUF2934 domain-containing protein [Polyangiaceae bacterium]